MQSNKNYLNNPQIHKNRKLSQATSEWVRSFSCEEMRPLIICRGPIRKEAMDVFDEMGIHGYGILLSEKDSITYTNALAPELRKLTDPDRVHRVPDYTGINKEERNKRIQQIIRIAKDLPNLVFENGEEPNFKKGELARALVDGDTAHIDYG